MTKINTFITCCGYGDLFMSLPYMEQRLGSSFVLSEHYSDNTGIPKVMSTLLPQLKYKIRSIKRTYGPKGIDRFLPNALNRIQACYRRPDMWDKITLSQESIDRLPPYKINEDFILVHPISIAKDKNYRFWDQIKFDLPIRVVAGWNQEIPTGWKQEVGDFYHTARLLRSCRGLVGVDSSVMNLAKIMRVPSVVIYPNTSRRNITPCYGLPLVDPSPREVSDAIKILTYDKIQIKKTWEF